MRGERYDAFIDAYVDCGHEAVSKCAAAVGGLRTGHGRRLLEKYRDRICTFNDDMQGTGAITLAAAISAVRVCGTPLRNQRIVIFGAGTAGIGVADQIRGAMVREGLSREDATRRFWFVDRHGLLTLRCGRAERPSVGVCPARGREQILAPGRRRNQPGGSGAPGEADDAYRGILAIRGFHRADRPRNVRPYRAADHVLPFDSGGPC